MTLVDVKINLTDVDKAIAESKALARELGRVFRALKPWAKRDQLDHAALTQGPDGPWPVRARATLERRQQRSRVVVTRRQTTRARKGGGAGASIVTRQRATWPLGTLPKSIRYRAERDALRASSGIEWAQAHIDGATVGRGAKLPARNYLWFSDPFLDMVAASIEDFVIAPWRGGATSFVPRVSPARAAARRAG